MVGAESRGVVWVVVAVGGRGAELVLAAVVLRDLAVGLQVDVILEVQRERILQRGDPQLLGVEWASLESSWDEGSTARGCR